MIAARATRSLTISSSLVALTISFASCAPKGPDLSVAVDALTMSPDVAHQEASATLAVTEMLNLRLPVDHGTGYAWGLAAPLGDDSPVAFASSAGETTGNAEQIQLGGKTWYLVTFVGMKPGSAVIDMVYTRPWESGVAPAKSYRVSVNVTKKQSN